MSGDRKPIPFARGVVQRDSTPFSPDGRFLAYQSNESGRAEIYVQSFPGPGGKWQISNAGGTDPHWRADGKELYYRGLDQKLMAVEIQAGDDDQGRHPAGSLPGTRPHWQRPQQVPPATDGQRFLFVAPLGRESMTPTTVVLNWFAELGK